MSAFLSLFVGIVGMLVLVGVPMWFASRPIKKKSFETGTDLNFKNQVIGDGVYFDNANHENNER
jgi:hypothetical protein